MLFRHDNIFRMDDGVNIQSLLTRSGLIGAGDYESAQEVAKFQEVPVGKILVASGRLEDAVFEAAVQVLTFIRDGLVSEENAVESLKLVSAQGLKLEDALSDLGCAIGDDASKLGNLLCSAKIVTRRQLYEAIHLGQETGIPLGECLKAHGILWEELLQHALSTQALLRSGFLDKEGAAKMIRTSFEGRVPVNYELSEFKVAGKQAGKSDATLATLAVDCGVLTEDQLSKISVEGQTDDALSSTLMQSNLLKKEQIDRLVAVKKMILAGTLDRPAAVKVLQNQRPLEVELSELVVQDSDNKMKIKFQDFLRIVGILDKQVLDRCGIGADRKPGSKDAIEVGKLLRDKGEVEARTIFAAMRCYYLMGTGWLTMEQGTCALAGFVAESSSQTFDAYLQKQEWAR